MTDEKQGHCPICLKEIDYFGSPEVIGGAVRYYITCSKDNGCGFVGYEWYTMEFDNQTKLDGKRFTDR